MIFSCLLELSQNTLFYLLMRLVAGVCPRELFRAIENMTPESADWLSIASRGRVRWMCFSGWCERLPRV